METVGILFMFFVPAYNRQALNWHHADTRYQALCTKEQTAAAFNNYCVYNAAPVGKSGESNRLIIFLVQVQFGFNSGIQFRFSSG